MIALIIINSLILFSLGLIHFYWFFGGKIDMEKVVPTIEERETGLRPPMLATLLVAIGLIGFGLVMWANTGVFAAFVSDKVIYYTTWVIGIIFLLRAIGEFKYVGLFKKVKNSPFAEYDTKYYVPLCLVIGTLSVLIVNLA